MDYNLRINIEITCHIHNTLDFVCNSYVYVLHTLNLLINIFLLYVIIYLKIISGKYVFHGQYL